MTKFTVEEAIFIHFLGINSEIYQMFVDLKQAGQSVADKTVL